MFMIMTYGLINAAYLVFFEWFVPYSLSFPFPRFFPG